MKSSKKEDARLLAILRDPQALIDDWKCPCCGREFSDQDACPHGWGEVQKANDKFLLASVKR